MLHFARPILALAVVFLAHGGTTSGPAHAFDAGCIERTCLCGSTKIQADCSEDCVEVCRRYFGGSDQGAPEEENAGRDQGATQDSRDTGTATEDLNRIEQDRLRDGESIRDFEKGKIEALDMLKRAGDPKLKSGSSGASEAKLKRPFDRRPSLKLRRFSKPSRITTPVDLSDLDPRRRLVVKPDDVRGMSVAEMTSAGHKAGYILDAFELAQGDWHAAIGHLAELLAADPGDIDARDALNYVKGLYRGHLGARDTANLFYKHGVRHWVSGQHGQAFAFFLQAARQNPDDAVLHRTAAHTLGLIHGHDLCRSEADCAMRLPGERIGFTSAQEQRLARVRRHVNAYPGDLVGRAALNMMEGMAVHHAYAKARADDPGPQLSPSGWEALTTALGRIETGDPAGAVGLIARAAQEAGGNFQLDFALAYARGRAAAAVGEKSVEIDRFSLVLHQILAEEHAIGPDGLIAVLPPDADMLRRYLDEARFAENLPFFGHLTAEEREIVFDRDSDDSRFLLDDIAKVPR